MNVSKYLYDAILIDLKEMFDEMDDYAKSFYYKDSSDYLIELFDITFQFSLVQMIVDDSDPIDKEIKYLKEMFGDKFVLFDYANKITSNTYKNKSLDNFQMSDLKNMCYDIEVEVIGLATSLAMIFENVDKITSKDFHSSITESVSSIVKEFSACDGELKRKEINKGTEFIKKYFLDNAR